MGLCKYRAVTYDKNEEMQQCKQDDRLPAISGIAKEVQQSTGYNYKAGLWLEDIHYGFLWDTGSSTVIRCSISIAPSWSWTSLEIDKSSYEPRILKRRIYFDKSWETEVQYAATIIDVSIINVADEPFSQVISGPLTVYAPLQKVCNAT